MKTKEIFQAAFQSVNYLLKSLYFNSSYQKTVDYLEYRLSSGVNLFRWSMEKDYENTYHKMNRKFVSITFHTYHRMVLSFRINVQFKSIFK